MHQAGTGSCRGLPRPKGILLGRDSVVAMNIRALTGFLSLADPLPVSALDALGALQSAARDEFARAGFPLQTTRLATQPVSEIAPGDLARFARELEQQCKAHGVEYASLGAPRADHRLAPLEILDEIPAALAATQNVNVSVQVASRENGINLRAVSAAAQAVRKIADLMPDGFGGFRFAVLANVPPFSPFFPAAYRLGTEPAFALAAEGAPLAVDALSRAHSLEQARAGLVRAIESTSAVLVGVANGLAARFGFRFMGIDFSLAPFPAEAQSIGTAVERLTGVPFGEHGTLFAVGFMTDCIQRANFPRVGFSGVLLPVLEDATLAARSGAYSLDSLLLYSTVCGTGLDTIPLPGDTSAGAIAAILLDMATLAVKLDKPLTARLIPLPGLQAGDMTRFNWEYFANARVLDTRARALKFFETDTQVQFKTRD